MLFNSPEFLLVFFPATLLGFFLLARLSTETAAAWLGIASLVFYGWWSLDAVPLLVGSICSNFAVSRWLVPTASLSEQTRRYLMYGAVGANLALLGFFKYANFFVDNMNAGLVASGGSAVEALNIALPIGISFYTFTQIAFLVDCWKGKVAERNFSHYLLFVTYFPHLIAGPVLHHSQMMPQFASAQTYRFNSRTVFAGLTIFALGLAKKVIIADSLADFVNPAFEQAALGETVSFVDGWAAAVGYALQLYFDFSGYSDMAIGISLCFGVQLPINFNAPYRATSIIEFWRRWHISLSTFLRDYLYIPLGGNKLGPVRRHLNLFITMVLGGLWHGASWNFVLWGALHGLFLAVNHAWRRITGPARFGLLGRCAAWFVTFTCVCIAWVLFRAADLTTAASIYRGMMGLNGVVLPEQVANLVPFLKSMVYTVGKMPTLGGGSVMGVFEQLVITVFGLAVALFAKQVVALSTSARLGLICLGAGFAMHSIFFALPKEFSKRGPSTLLTAGVGQTSAG